MTYWCLSLKQRASNCLKGSTDPAAKRAGWWSKLRLITSQPVIKKGRGDLVWACVAKGDPGVCWWKRVWEWGLRCLKT